MKDYKQIKKLYTDHKSCAKRFGLNYIENYSNWISRTKKGESFVYKDGENKTIDSKKLLKYIEELVIPPMWKQTRISPDKNNHILAIGLDAAERHQYLYHEKWGEARNLLNSYKLIIFGNYLSDIRKQAKKYIRDYEPGSFQYALGAFIIITDVTTIRVGSEYYLNENDTIGLSVIQKEHIIQKSGRIYFQFTGKSSKKHKIIITDKKSKSAIKSLLKLDSNYLFSYERDGKSYHIKASHANDFIKKYGNELLSIKDFRTWHASVIFFENIYKNIEKEMSDKERKKLILSSFDEAASKLGNTRAIVRSSYVHSDMVESVEEHDFITIYNTVKTTKKRRNLSKTETRFLSFLEYLYEHNFEI